jgi:NADH:ubiquinone oxidoreductase subunit 2 (subunit N)
LILNLALFSPEISLAGFVVVVILLDLFIERKGWLAGVSIVGLLVSAAFALSLWGGNPQTTFNAC